MYCGVFEMMSHKKKTLATFWQWEKQYEGEGVAGLVTS
jgi:hypothetical protein